MIVRRNSGVTLRPGVTLLEVLVSMAILLVAFGALSELVNFGARNAQDSTFESDGTRLALSTLAEIEAGVVPLDGAASGAFDLEPEWNWSMEPTQTDVPNVYLVTVTVSRTPGQFNLKLSQMVFDPRQMGNSSEIVKPTATTGAAAP